MKVTKTLLTIFLTLNPNLLFAVTLKPSDCETRGLSCSCFTKEDTRKIAGGIASLKICRYELKLSQDFLSAHKIEDTKLPFYKEPSFIAGGLVISFGVGGLITYLLMSRN